MSETRLGVYWSPHHTRYNDADPSSDTAYIARLQPAWIRIHQPTAAAIYHAQRVAPRAKIMLRSWDIDDHNGDRKNEMYADPTGAANKHRLMWHDLRARLIDELHRNGQGYDISKWHYGLVNEPDPAHMDALVAYTEEAMRRGPELNMRFGVGVASVGTFAKPSESPHGWAKFAKLERAIRDGGHILIIHEYWQPEGPTCVWTDNEGRQRHDAGNLAWRHRDIPMDVPILIGEAGANGYIFNRYSNKDDAGWGRFMNAEQYAAQVHEYVRGCDSRVEGVCLYMTDYHSDQWQSFDTHAAHAALLAIRDVRPEQRYKAHVPIVVTPPAPEPPATDTWQRSRAFVARWEGGFVNNINDPGGATNMGITRNTLSAWRAIKGLPAPTVEDVRNLTRSEADAIYFAWYWQESGADKLPWPAALVVFDTAVLHGTGRARAWWQESDGSITAYLAKRLESYTRMAHWQHFGAGWVRRVADLLKEVA